MAVRLRNSPASSGAKEVPVSAHRPCDQRRTLCVPCEEAYTWGVQHGSMRSKDVRAEPWLNRFLGKQGFVIVVKNMADPSPDGPFEAWAYQGPLDMDEAVPVTFGVGASSIEALEALEGQLARRRSLRRKPARTTGAGKHQAVHRQEHPHG